MSTTPGRLAHVLAGRAQKRCAVLWTEPALQVCFQDWDATSVLPRTGDRPGTLLWATAVGADVSGEHMCVWGCEWGAHLSLCSKEMDPPKGLACSVCPCTNTAGDICSSRVFFWDVFAWISWSKHPQGRAGRGWSHTNRSRELHLVEAALWSTAGQCLLFPFSCTDCRNVFGWKMPPRDNSKCLPSFNLKAL